MKPGSTALDFVDYFAALHTFLKKGQVLHRYALVSGNLPSDLSISDFETTQEPVSTVIKQMLKKTKIEFLVAFGHLEELTKCISDFRLKNAILITDDPLPPANQQPHHAPGRVLPGRIFDAFHDLYWWNVTPFEYINERDIQSGLLPDKTMNELQTLTSLALECYKHQRRKECQDLVDLCLSLYPRHVPNAPRCRFLPFL